MMNSRLILKFLKNNFTLFLSDAAKTVFISCISWLVFYFTDHKAQDVLSELRKICRGLFPLFGHIFPSQHRQPIHFPLLAGWIQTALVISLYMVSVVLTSQWRRPLTRTTSITPGQGALLLCGSSSLYSSLIPSSLSFN